ncbi:MAG: hypothetical protein ACI9IP_001262 [Arcticibacterium sp.]|jgi:hypothetical protein
MKILSKLFVLFLAGTVTFVACDDKFLDGPAQGVLDGGTLVGAGPDVTLIAAYSLLDGFAAFGGWGGAGSNWIFGSVASDDAVKGSEPGDQQATTDVEIYQWSTGAANGYLNDKWANVYEGVSRANSTLQILANAETLSESEKNRIEGESKFLRAHYHFEAYRFWKNVPYYTEDDVDFKKPNNVDILPNIISDLERAIATLPVTQNDAGRVTKWTAKAYLGRVKLHGGDMAGANAILADVVNNGPYGLQDCFHEVFSALVDNGPETILAYQASSNDGDPNGANGNQNDRLNFPHSGSPFGCCGFHQPTQNLVNAFKVDANGLPMLDGTWNDADLTAADAVDPRLDWTSGRDGVPYLDWGTHAPGWIRDRPWAGPYSPKKNVYEKNSSAGSTVGWANYQLNSLNLHLLRFADVVLMYAETEVEMGNLENARTLVNRIRTRAGNCAPAPEGAEVTTTLDDPRIDWANYKVGTYDATWTDQAVARTAVRFERRLELAMEGHRFFDLRRWGTAASTLNAFVASEIKVRAYLNAATAYDSKHDLYPIPTTQIDLSIVDGVKTLEQNPGW